MLQVFEDADNGLLSKEDLLKILQLIQSYVWRRFIVGLQTNALNKIFMTLYAEVDTEDYFQSIAKALLKKKGSAKFPSNEDLKTALRDRDLYNIQPKNRNYLFEKLENYNNREYVNTDNEFITIEHIFPKNPSGEWLTDISQEDYFLFTEKYLNTIANLTLSGNNGALGNNSFEVKKTMNIDGKEQGYLYSRLWLNNYLKTLDKWTVVEYDERLNIIYERFLKIWAFPDVELSDEEETEEQNIFDADIPTNKKLEYFIIENTRVDEDAVAQMYFYVIRYLYEKNSQLLVSNQSIFRITRNAEDLRAAKEVINGWYIETNIDSNSKFSIIKRLLTLFEMEGDLFIKYSSYTDDKTEPNRFAIRKKYWHQLLPLLLGTNLFDNVRPSKDHWLHTGAGIGGLVYTLIITKSHVRIELGISTSSKEKNKAYFKKLLKSKNAIEEAFGQPLEWEELSENKMSRVKFELQDVSIFQDSHWERMNQFFVENLPLFERAFSPYIKALR